MRMRRRHNSGMQLLVCTVYIINALSHSATLWPLHACRICCFTLPCWQLRNSMYIMYIGSYVVEDIRITCSRGTSEASPAACNLYSCTFCTDTLGLTSKVLQLTNKDCSIYHGLPTPLDALYCRWKSTIFEQLKLLYSLYHCLDGIKDATSLECSGLVWFVGLCAQTMVAICTEKVVLDAEQATKPWMKWGKVDCFFFVIRVDS